MGTHKHFPRAHPMLMLEIAIRSDFIGRSGPMDFSVGLAGNNFYFLNTFVAGIIKFTF